jgi:ABC-type multidrug transport system fused ATPase/permease subunit
MSANAPRELRVLMAKLWQHIGSRRRRQSLLLFLLMLVSAFADVVSLGAVLPFLGILTSPDAVFGNPLLSGFIKRVGITSPDQLVLPLTLAFVAAAIVAGVIRIFLLWLSTRYAHATGAELSSEVYRRTLYQPYSVHVSRNSSEVISGITNKVGGAVNVLNQTLTLLSSVVMLVVVTAALVLIDPVVALVASIGFGSCYVMIAWLTRSRLRSNSRRIAQEQTRVVKSLQEGLGGIRDVLLDGTQPLYCEIYRQSDQPMRHAQGNSDFIGLCPRYAMEAIGMVLIALLAYGLSKQPGGISQAIPILGALALGAQRLLPALQQAFGSWSTIQSLQSQVAATVDLLDQPVDQEQLHPTGAPLELLKGIAFRAVRFRYAEGGPWAIDGLDLSIPKGARVAFVGSTGSGKSTAIDLLMGLLKPTEGQLLVDGEPVAGNRVRAWQRSIAHVPQSIYLADATLAENVAFGIARHAIDMARVREAVRQAQLTEFVESRPEGYDAVVGERGVRLSGGQRQRIGIARALYKQATVLVFDEATSALDNATEKSVMDAIESLDRDLTILLIAHRLTTVRRCDTVVEMEQGRVVSQGTYDELLQSSPSFRHMVEVPGWQ